MDKQKKSISAERSEMLEKLYENAPSAIVELELEPELRVTGHNAAACRTLGLEKDFTIDDLNALISPNDRKRCFGVLKRAELTGAKSQFELMTTLADGSQHWLTVFVYRLPTPRGRFELACVLHDDTSTRENADQMKQNYLRYKTIIEMNSINACELDMAGRTVLFSSGCMRLFGVPQEKMAFDDKRLLDMLYIDDRAEYRQAVDRALAGKAKDSARVRLIRSDGSIKWHTITLQPVINEQNETAKLMGVIESIDTSGEMQQVMASVVEADHDALMLIDTSNRTYRQFTRSGMSASIPLGGESTGEVFSDFAREILKSRGITDFSVCDLPDRLKLSEIRGPLTRDGSFTLVYPVELNGDARFKRIRLQRYDPAGTVFLVILTDVTIETTEERRKQRQLEDALCEAEQAAQAKQDFLSNMSHEIRTPLNGIKGMLDLLHQRGELRDDTYINNALNATDHLTALINDILDMSRIDSGKVELKPIATSCAELLDYIDSIIAPMAQEKGISLTNETDFRDCEFVMADSGRLKQIMLNILTNAVKYTNYGGRVRSVFKLRRLSEGRAALLFSVTDSGIGMSSDFIRRAFEPFEQEKADGARPGTGLGLAITRRLINLMHGTISIDSEQGVGTSVNIEIELDTATEDDLEQRSTASKEPKTLMLNRKRALIAEDNELNMEIADIQIRSFGLKTDRAFDGQQAVEMFNASRPGYYDIIFMDIMMPKLDGLEATKQIRSSERPDAASVKIIAMTANAFIEDIHKSRESGMDMHLSKPFDRKDLAAVLSSAFGAQE